MNGGDGTHSYSRNSSLQRLAANFEMEKIKEEIANKFDLEILLSISRTIRIADFGCATGPNTIVSVQTLVDSVKRKYQTVRKKSEAIRPEFQVFFNDIVTNDFNTLFKSLPTDRDYFAAAAPGSFYNQIFPEASLHFAYTSYALHWLSKLPAQLSDETSPSWNKGRIFYSNAHEEVVRAYKSQFDEDIELFMEARAKELVVGGMLVIIMPGSSPDFRTSSSTAGLMFDFVASSLMEMAQEGLIKESQVDSFNIPVYMSVSPEDMTSLVEKNGCFSIERIELNSPKSSVRSPGLVAGMMHMRATTEGNFIKHFGSKEIVDEVFKRSTQKLLQHSTHLPQCEEKVQMFVVLKRIEKGI